MARSSIVQSKIKSSKYGSFYIFSPNTGFYRAKLLGLLTTHTLISVLELFFQLPLSSAKICSDNSSTLYNLKECRCRIPTGASQVDIKRVLRNFKSKLTASSTYEWVQSHEDR